MALENGIYTTILGMDWIYKYGIPIMANDVVGYLVRVTEKEGCIFAVDGRIIPASFDKEHLKLSLARLRKMFEVLSSSGFIADAESDPFPELLPKLQIKFNPNEAIIADRDIVVWKNKKEFVPDDDFGGEI